MMALERMPDLPVLVTASAEWHPGVVGLISARTKERFRRPAFAFTLNQNGTATGSGRSVPGVDLGYAVRAAVEAGLAIKGGGHTMAAGVTIQAVDLERFLAFVTEKLTEPVSTMRLGDNFAVDATLTAAGAQPAVVTALERAGPFGQGQPEPVFVFPQHRLIEAREVGSGGHMRVKLRGGDGSSIGGIAFRAAGQPLGNALSQSIGNPLHVAGTLSIDRWGGNEKVEVRIMDAARPE
jgi:single-stranded-DNA-specific exonuclease